MLFTLPFEHRSGADQHRTLPIRWYALAYITGLFLAGLCAALVTRKTSGWCGAVAPLDIDDLLSMRRWAYFRRPIGYVISTMRFLSRASRRSLAVWKGECRSRRPRGTLLRSICLQAQNLPSEPCDVCAAAVPIGLFLGDRQFHQAGTWGRRPMCLGDGLSRRRAVARHPSQPNEAGSKGWRFLRDGSRYPFRRAAQARSCTGISPLAMGWRALSANFFANRTAACFLFGGATMECSCRSL